MDFRQYFITGATLYRKKAIAGSLRSITKKADLKIGKTIPEKDNQLPELNSM
jgi:hypothetical protein